MSKLENKTTSNKHIIRSINNLQGGENKEHLGTDYKEGPRKSKYNGGTVRG